MKYTLFFLLLTIPFMGWSQITGTPYLPMATNHPSTNGSGIVSNYTCNTGSTGNLLTDTAVSNVSQTITATVILAGSFNISATMNGVTFAAEGEFTETGSKTIVLTASGKPLDIGTHQFNLNTTPHCGFQRTTYKMGLMKISATQTQLFMLHNLGANTNLDPNVPAKGIHGNYYQWGSKTAAGTPDAIIGTWKNIRNHIPASRAWREDTKTANDPCPSGYKVPSTAQWTGLSKNNTITRTGSWTFNVTNYTNAVHYGPHANLKLLTLPAAGYRYENTGKMNLVGTYGYYWTSQNWYRDKNNNQKGYAYLIKDRFDDVLDPIFLTQGNSVRCIAQ